MAFKWILKKRVVVCLIIMLCFFTMSSDRIYEYLEGWGHEKVTVRSADGTVYIDGAGSLGRDEFIAALDKAGIGLGDVHEIIVADSFSEIGFNCFGGCHNLSTAKLGNNVRSIKAYAFLNCSNLTRLFLSEKLEVIGKKAFFNCGNIKYVYAAEDKKELLYGFETAADIVWIDDALRENESSE